MAAEFTKTWTYKIHPSSKHFQDYAIKCVVVTQPFSIPSEEGTSAFVAQIFGTSKRDALPYARLIAACPTMYEALKAVHDEMLFDAQNNHLDNEHQLMFDNISAALALAEKGE